MVFFTFTIRNIQQNTYIMVVINLNDIFHPILSGHNFMSAE